jgi:hypothetical protein
MNMAEPTQYKFSFEEVAAALMKLQGIHEGLWQLAFEMNLIAGNFAPQQVGGVGTQPTETRPGAMFQIGSALLVRAPEGVARDTPLIFDAAILNKPESKKRRTRVA